MPNDCDSFIVLHGAVLALVSTYKGAATQENFKKSLLDAAESSTMLKPSNLTAYESLDNLLEAIVSPCSSFSSSESDCDYSTSRTNLQSWTRRRRVRFSDTINVRTHSIVMGDHPCCRQLAIELGWEHTDGSFVLDDGIEEVEDEGSSKDTSQIKKNNHGNYLHGRRRTFPRRRTYSERKFMLQEIAGMTDEEINQATLRQAVRDSSTTQQMRSRMTFRRSNHPYQPYHPHYLHHQYQSHRQYYPHHVYQHPHHLYQQPHYPHLPYRQPYQHPQQHPYQHPYPQPYQQPYQYPHQHRNRQLLVSSF